MTEKTNFYRSFDGMCWPAPSEKMGEISWRATHGTPTRTDLLVAASVMNAYQELIGMSAKRRDKIIKELRKGPGIVRAAQAGKGVQ